MKALTFLLMGLLLLGFTPDARSMPADLHLFGSLPEILQGSVEGEMGAYLWQGALDDECTSCIPALARENEEPMSGMLWISVGLLFFGFAATATAGFHLKGSLTGTLSGSGEQDQGGTMVPVNITGGILADIDESFALNVGDTHFVDIGGKIAISYQGISPYDLSNATVEADFTPKENAINFQTPAGLTVKYSPFYTIATPGEHVHQGFGFKPLRISYKDETSGSLKIGDSLSILLDDGHTIAITPTRSSFGVGDLGAMGGFNITLVS